MNSYEINQLLKGIPIGLLIFFALALAYGIYKLLKHCQAKKILKKGDLESGKNVEHKGVSVCEEKCEKIHFKPNEIRILETPKSPLTALMTPSLSPIFPPIPPKTSSRHNSKHPVRPTVYLLPKIPAKPTEKYEEEAPKIPPRTSSKIDQFTSTKIETPEDENTSKKLEISLFLDYSDQFSSKTVKKPPRLFDLTDLKTDQFASKIFNDAPEIPPRSKNVQFTSKQVENLKNHLANLEQYQNVSKVAKNAPKIPPRTNQSTSKKIEKGQQIPPRIANMKNDQFTSKEAKKPTILIKQNPHAQLEVPPLPPRKNENYAPERPPKNSEYEKIWEKSKVEAILNVMNLSDLEAEKEKVLKVKKIKSKGIPHILMAKHFVRNLNHKTAIRKSCFRKGLKFNTVFKIPQKLVECEILESPQIDFGRKVLISEHKLEAFQCEKTATQIWKSKPIGPKFAIFASKDHKFHFFNGGLNIDQVIFVNDEE